MAAYVLNQGFKFALYIYFLLYDWRMLGIYWTIVAVYTYIQYKTQEDSPNSNRSKIRIGTWDSPTTSAVYLKMQVPVEPFEKYAAQKLKQGVKVTMTHVAMKAIG